MTVVLFSYVHAGQLDGERNRDYEPSPSFSGLIEHASPCQTKPLNGSSNQAPMEWLRQIAQFLLHRNCELIQEPPPPHSFVKIGHGLPCHSAKGCTRFGA